MNDHKHEVEAVSRENAVPGSVCPWAVKVDGELLRSRRGQVRSFKTEDAAFEAGDLDAWLRDQ
jgi:hypothetical protein